MHAALTRYLRRHRARLIEAVATPLEARFGRERAVQEARGLIIGLERSLMRPDSTGFLRSLVERIESWDEAGLDSVSSTTALLGLVRAPAPTIGGPRSLERWTAELAPLLDAVPAPVLFVDLDMTVRIANRSFCETAGELREVLVGMPAAELLKRDAAVGAPNQRVSDHALIGRVRLSTAPESDLLASQFPFSPDGARIGWFLALSPGGMQELGDASLAELLEREKRQKENFSALLTVSRAVVNTLDLNTILTTIARQARQVIQTDECTVFLFDEREELLYPVVCDASEYVEEMMAVRLRPGEGITGTVALSGKGEIVNDAESDPRALSVPGTPVEQSSLLCVPLLSREKVVGVITMVRTGVRGFQAEDLELATLFAGQCSAAIANARLYAEQKSAFEELRQTQTQLVQSAKLNALGEMAGGVAHDFNNILAAILGRTQLLMQTPLDPEVRRQLAVIEQAALDGAQTVRRVQEFTRVRQDERFETLDVNQVLLGVIELTRPAWEAGAKRRGITIDVHLELRATHTTAGNASELREVFTNLVLNAVDALPWGGDLWVSTENGLDAIRVTFRDTGVGMDAETRAKVFDPFFTTKDVKGTGLGLSVAYGIVARHKGRIEVESEIGVGTVFMLTLPLGSVAGREPPRTAPGPLAQRRVLVVDDEEAVLHVLVDLLRALEQDVTAALGGAAGLEALSKGSFDVVFSDLGMPDVNGWDLALQVKSRSPGTAVVLVTGWGFQLEEETATARGIDLIMPKPFSWDDVERALRKVADFGARRDAA